MGFAGTVSLERYGFRYLYELNGHGANLDPLAEAASRLTAAQVRVKSWWEFAPVNRLRKELYDDWEGMHATPSEIAIAQIITGHLMAPWRQSRQIS